MTGLEKAASECGISWQYCLRPGLWLCAGRELRPPRPGEIYLRRGRAFPVGHPTTRLCLDLLREILADRQPATLLEVGCGSGVLCLAAAALGVSWIVGVDLDRAAVWETRENAALNHLTRAIRVVQGSTECLLSAFDLVIANLPWEVQLAKAPEFQRLTTPGGTLILSGYREPEEQAILALYPAPLWERQQRRCQAFHHPELPPHYNFTWVAWQLRRC